MRVNSERNSQDLFKIEAKNRTSMNTILSSAAVTAAATIVDDDDLLLLLAAAIVVARIPPIFC
jgi:hypothetical protein